MDNGVDFKPIGDFLKAVAEFNPDLARPELWDNTSLESFLSGDLNPLHLFVHHMIDNMHRLGLHNSLEPGLLTMYLLGYYSGQSANKQGV